nr:hypothetical protein [Flavisolibacter nicotianae]
MVTDLFSVHAHLDMSQAGNENRRFFQRLLQGNCLPEKWQYFLMLAPLPLPFPCSADIVNSESGNFS